MEYLILDLDNTLITLASNKPDFTIDINEPFKNCVVTTIGIKKRPYLDFFFNVVSKKYKVIIWSNGTSDYVHKVLDGLNTDIHFYNVITRDTFCKLPIKDVKDLKTIMNINLNNVLFIDDSPEHIIGLKEHQIIIAPKYIGLYDTFLIDVIYYLV